MTMCARVYGLETVSRRYFNIFGPHQDARSQYSGVLARFISQMLRQDAPIIFGDGETSRDFTHVDNVVFANLLAAKAPRTVSGKVFNVGTGRGVTLLQAVESIRALVGYPGKPVFSPERVGDIKHSVADISLAREQLGYHVATDFENGIAGTIEWCKGFQKS